MATKSGLIATVNGFITAVITQLKVRNAFSAVIDNGFPSTITESYTNLATTITNTAIITNHYYTTYWKKQGNVVHIKGKLTNKTGSSTSNEDWFTIPVAEYFPFTTPLFFYGVSETDGRNIKCQVSGTTIKIVSLVSNNESVIVDFTYFAQN